VLNNQDNIRALAPVTTVMLHALGTQFTRFTGTKVQTLDVEGAAKKKSFNFFFPNINFFSIFFFPKEPSRQRCASCIPQAVPQLVSLLVSRQPTTVREAAFALSLTSMSPEGRVAILSMPQVCVCVCVCYRDAALLRRRADVC